MEELNKLIEKYNLPKLEEFQIDFGHFEEQEHPSLTDFRSKIAEKIDYFVNLISEIIQPDTDLASIYEYKYQSEAQRQELFNIFRTLLSYSRKSSSLSTFYDEEKEVEFIKDFYNEWQLIKKVIKKELELLSDMWKNDIGSDEIIENYMG